MADFSKCKQGDKLKSERYGEVYFLIYEESLAPYQIVCRVDDNEVARWTADGTYFENDGLPDLSIPPKTKTVKYWVGYVGKWGLAATKTKEELLRDWSDAQDVHEIEFTVREEEK